MNLLQPNFINNKHKINTFNDIKELPLKKKNKIKIEKKLKNSSKRCKNCKKKKGIYLIECKKCNKKFCIKCLGFDIHNCIKKDEYLSEQKKKLEETLKSADSNFFKINKI